MKEIYVTRPFLPPKAEFLDAVEEVYESQILTNEGPKVNQLENTLKDFLGVENFHYVTNGTIALQLALKALDITEGEIITTPFSYVATTSAILWERCKPIFADISPSTLNIDPEKVENLISRDTKAILAVHVFGIPCDVVRLQQIADKHGIPLIFDGAHAFGTEYRGKSLLSYGTISTCSFHATKLFHTVEGGCVVHNSDQLSNKLNLIKKFGHWGDDHYCLGINGKQSEINAAIGLLNFKYFDFIKEERKKICEAYEKRLSGQVQFPLIPLETKRNYAYFPIILRNEEILLKVMKALEKIGVHTRRYFYPSLNLLPYLSYQKCSVSEDISKRILCLPLYVGLPTSALEQICDVIASMR